MPAKLTIENSFDYANPDKVRPSELGAATGWVLPLDRDGADDDSPHGYPATNEDGTAPIVERDTIWIHETWCYDACQCGGCATGWREYPIDGKRFHYLAERFRYDGTIQKMSTHTPEPVNGGPCHRRLVLHLPLTFHWYDETARGAKCIEYRVMKPRWEKQIWDRRDEITHVRFSRGYTSRTIEYPVERIDKGSCPIPGWTDQYFRIHFTQNVV